jgi:uncharacterized protein DUF642/PEP-CTERM motif-containing protein
MQIFKKASIATIALVLSAPVVQANLIINGGFEDGSHRNDLANYMVLNPGDTDLGSWTIDATIAWGINATDGFSASQGVGFVDLSSVSNTSPTGAISQTISTVVGTNYLFSIDRQGFGSTVSLDGVDITLTQGASNGAWTTFTASYVATSINTQFSIRNTSAGSSIVFADAISFVEVVDPTPVPEPSALGLLGAGLLGLGFMRRRRVA